MIKAFHLKKIEQISKGIMMLPVVFGFTYFTVVAQETETRNGGAYLHSNIQISAPNPISSFSGFDSNVGVDKFTGRIVVNIPLIDLPSRELSESVGLIYSSNGIRVGDNGDVLGIGWQLQAGGKIVRDMKGFPDEQLNIGYFYTGNRVAEFTNASDGDKGNFLAGVVGNNFDPEPDVFEYSFEGQNGKFVIDHNQDIHLIPHRNWEINKVIESNQIVEFSIITDTGTEYVFGRDINAIEETSIKSYTFPVAFVEELYNLPASGYPIEFYEIINQTNGYIDGFPLGIKEYRDPFIHEDHITENRSNSAQYTSAWHLTKKESINGDFINYSYSLTNELQLCSKLQWHKIEIVKNPYYGTPFQNSFDNNNFVVEFLEPADEITVEGTTYSRRVLLFNNREDIPYYAPAYSFISNWFYTNRSRLTQIETSLGNKVVFENIDNWSQPNDFLLSSISAYNYRGDEVKKFTFNYDNITSTDLTGNDPVSLLDALLYKSASFNISGKIMGHDLDAKASVVINKFGIKGVGIVQSFKPHQYRRCFLSSVQEVGTDESIKRHKFSYISPEELPRKTTINQTVWGFKRKEISENSYDINSADNKLFNVSTNDGVPDKQLGLLKTIVTPLGSSHKIFYRDDTYETDVFVSKIQHFSDENSLIKCVNYLYVRPQGTRGLATSHTTFQSLPNVIGRVGYTISSNVIQTNFTLTKGNYFFFTNVYEIEGCDLDFSGFTSYDSEGDYYEYPDNYSGAFSWPKGYIKYSFTGAERSGIFGISLTDNSPNLYSVQSVPISVGATTDKWQYDQKLAGKTDVYYERGLPLSVEYYNSDNQLLKKSVYEYAFSPSGMKKRIVPAINVEKYSHAVVNENVCVRKILTICDWEWQHNPKYNYLGRLYGYYSSNLFLNKIKEYDYTKTGGGLISTNYLYYNNATLSPTRSLVEFSDGSATKEEYLYVTDLLGSSSAGFTPSEEFKGFITLKTNNYHLPIGSIKYKRINSSTQFHVIESRFTSYKKFYRGITDSYLFPSLIKPYKEYVFLSKDYITENNFIVPHLDGSVNQNLVLDPAMRVVHENLEFDGFSNLKSHIDSDGLRTEYFRDKGFNDEIGAGIYPIKKIVAEGTPLEMAYLYTWKPMVGMLSETDPNGYQKFYEYDNFNRLALVRDNDNNIIKRYQYYHKAVEGHLGSTFTYTGVRNPGGVVTFTIPSNFNNESGHQYSYQWNWGDGTGTYSTTNRSITHVFQNPGIYQVFVGVKYSLQETAMRSETVEIVNALSNPTVSLIGLTYLDICNNANNTYTSGFNGEGGSTFSVNINTNSPGCSPYKYTWYQSFNSAPAIIVSTEDVLRKDFSSEAVGAYTIYCVVTDACGISKTTNSKVVTVAKPSNCSTLIVD